MLHLVRHDAEQLSVKGNGDEREACESEAPKAITIDVREVANTLHCDDERKVRVSRPSSGVNFELQSKHGTCFWNMAV